MRSSLHSHDVKSAIFFTLICLLGLSTSRIYQNKVSPKKDIPQSHLKILKMKENCTREIWSSFSNGSNESTRKPDFQDLIGSCFNVSILLKCPSALL